jgi:RNA polymerase sigma factor (sigma-70 family)
MGANVNHRRGPESIPQDIVLLAERAVQLLKGFRQTKPVTDEDRRLARQARLLFEANANETVGVHGALYSAWFEFEESWAQVPREGDLGERARELIRVAYNRAQRQRRSNVRLQAETARGESQTPDGNRLLDRLVEDPQSFLEIRAQLAGLFDGIYDGLDDRDREILSLSAEGLTQQEVAARLHCHRTTVSRVLSRVHDKFDRFVVESLPPPASPPG